VMPAQSNSDGPREEVTLSNWDNLLTFEPGATVMPVDK
jgi:hypothetical protein